MKIYFENGIPGFEEYKEFEINQVGDSNKFKMITSTKDSNIGFVAISPFEIDKQYEINLSDEVIKELQIDKSEDVLLLNLITLGSTLGKSTVNLKAPVIINIKNKKGKQLILQDDKYSIKEPLV